MNETKICPECGTQFPPDAPAGVCPKCLLKAGIEESFTAAGDKPTLVSTPDSNAGTTGGPPTEYQTRGPSQTPQPGTRVRYIGDYEVLEEIARGGMGVVYRARQVKLNRTVALKMILSGQFAGAADVERFHSEAEAAAGLDHPGIVPIFEVGEHEGRHYFSMGLVEGDSLADRVKEGPLPPREAAGIVRQVAEAIAYAHDKGVIHRDLKPSNILLDRDGQPRVTDFGLAKRLEGDSGLTATGQVVGTPSYMPPEQASGKIHDVGPRSDVYSLGAILYCLFTGRPPFQADNPIDTLKQVIEKEPVAPRQWNPSIPQDLETICLKCLQKDHRQRYGSMQELRDELDRFCEGRPILARPIGRIERAWRWCRRNPAFAVASGLAVTALAATVVLAVIFAVYQSRAADRSNILLAESYLEKGQDLSERGDIARGVLWMARGLETAPESAPELQHTIRANLGAWMPPPAGLRESLTLQNGVSVVAFSADGKTLMTEEGTHTAQFWETDTLKQIRKVEHRLHATGDTPCKTVAFHPGGTMFATECYDINTSSVAQLWDVDKRRVIRRFVHPPSETGKKPAGNTYAVCLVFSRDGKTLATVDHDKRVLLWDVSTGKQIGPPVSSDMGQLHTDWIEALAFSPEEKIIATGSRDKTVRLWETTTGEPVGQSLPHDGWVRAIVFSPDGKSLLTGSLDGKARLWNVDTGELIGTPFALGGQKTNQGGAAAVAFSPDGSTILTAMGHDARYWDAATLQPIGQSLRHENDVFSVAFSPDGKTVLTGSWDGTARLWDVPDRSSSEMILPHELPVFDAVFSPDGKTIGTASFREIPGRTVADPRPYSEARLWDAETGKPLGDPLPHQIHQERPLTIAFSPDGKLFAMLSEFWDFDASRSRSVVHLWNVAAREPVGKPLIQMVEAGDWATGFEQLVFADDARTLTATDREGLIQVWDLATGEPVGEPGKIENNFPRAFSPDGKTLLVGRGHDNTAFLADAAKSTNSNWSTLGAIQHLDSVDAVAFSPGGTLLLTGSADKTARLWDAVTLKPIGPPLQHDDLVRSVCFSPDGRTILTASFDTTVKLRRVPPVLEGDIERIALWAEVNSGTALKGQTLDVLSADEWLNRKQQLDQSGGPPLP